MMLSPAIQELVNSLRALPGFGIRSAQRTAMHLLEQNPTLAKRLLLAIEQAILRVRRCEKCRTLCESSLCPICQNQNRNHRQLCIVETPMDLVAIEQAGHYQGVYFVLLGRLSPLDGIGPEELKLDELGARLIGPAVEELILATNPTVEGEATAHYIRQIAKQHGKKISRIAYGIPFGGELEFTDSVTLSHAFLKREFMDG